MYEVMQYLYPYYSHNQINCFVELVVTNCFVMNCFVQYLDFVTIVKAGLILTFLQGHYSGVFYLLKGNKLF